MESKPGPSDITVRELEGKGLEVVKGGFREEGEVKVR